MAYEKTTERRLALVTGATKGIGLALSRMLVACGYRVVGCYGHDDRTAEEVRGDPGFRADDFVLVKADMSSPDSAEILAEAVDQEGGALSCLISNVGVTDKTPFGRVTLEKWEWTIRTNLTMPFFLTQRLSDKIVDGAGKIVFIGAVMGIRPHPMSFSYGTSKAGLHFLAQSLVKVMSPRGITVNVVAPGFVDTVMQSGKAADHRKRVESKISLRRFAKAEEVAAAVKGILDLDYVTGQVLCVDGGYDFE